MTKPTKHKPMMSIGSLSKATGVPVNTIRTWERRYGFPVAERTPGGHRQYPASLVPHLALVKNALDSGHRPGQVLRLSIQALRELVGLSRPAVDVRSRSASSVAALLDATSALDAQRLDQLIATELSRCGAVDFLEDHAIPLLTAVGDGWAAGRLEVFHEHFASERLVTLLSARWRAIAPPNTRSVVLATLPGEDHVLGLHMAALVLAQSGLLPIFLGSKTPTRDVVACARQVGACCVGLSVSVHAEPSAVLLAIAELTAHLPDGVELVCGGGGAPDVPGLVRFQSLRELETWAIGRS